jgi:methyl-CpG-binding domain protein 4
MLKPGWYPPRSPLGLIQEDLFPSEWNILVACLMLNCTSRRQVEQVMPEFMRRWPTAADVAAADTSDLTEVIRSLGFGNRRANNLQALARAFLSGGWTDSRDLPHIGEYAGRAHDIFCRGIIGSEPPNDHALTDYWHWVQIHHPVLTVQQ